ncbi:MAG: YdcF family protein, partial [Clostridia bacterium]|nr:YdcF family protein [Clostridia bacterium]
MRRNIKIIISLIAAVFAATMIFVIVVNLHIVSFSRKYMFDSTAELAASLKSEVQAVVVLGARVYADGTPCAMLKDRLDAGLMVIEEGITKKILLTGDHGTKGYDEVNSMKNYTLDAGLTKEMVYLDHAGFSTYDSMVRAARIFEITDAVISTQEFHLYRAIYIARKNGVEAWGIKADLRNYPKSEMTRYTVREWLARTKDFIYIHILGKEPVFLGEIIPISGDSSLT